MEIVPNVHLIAGTRGANAYLLAGSMPTLVDTGMPGSAPAILGAMQRLGLSPSGLGRIVITHHHFDHAGSLAAVKQRTAAQVFAHAADVPFISGVQPPPPPQNAVTRLLFSLFGRLPVLRSPAAAVDVPLQDGDRLDVLGGVTVVHVPGHTPGAIALHLPAEGVLICGDSIRVHGRRLLPPDRIFTADIERAMDSLRRMATLEFDVLCPGHGTPLAGGAGEKVRALVREMG